MGFLDQIDALMRKQVKALNYDKSYEMFLTINSGKKLRSKLIAKIAGESKITLELCAIIEMIHAASLLHDDVIDESDTRRGKPSTNATFGSKNAIMLGDILYTLGYKNLVSYDKFIAQSVADAVCNISIGELMDANLSQSFNENKQKYTDMIYYKTAALIESCCESAAFLVGFDTDDFREYGKNLGIAFQIIDDLLDVTSDDKTLGKPAFSDFVEGKTTLPFIYLYEVLDTASKQKLKSLFKKELNKDEIKFIKDKFNEFNIIQKCYNEAKSYANLAIQKVSKYDDKELVNIVSNLVDRKF
ncbi:MAG: polyprenyl synthetase family protein [Campylobacter sp.]|nr:polyprenyl synthetase family protein [Campylobacter sp.]